MPSVHFFLTSPPPPLSLSSLLSSPLPLSSPSSSFLQLECDRMGAIDCNSPEVSGASVLTIKVRASPFPRSLSPSLPPSLPLSLSPFLPPFPPPFDPPSLPPSLPPSFLSSVPLHFGICLCHPDDWDPGSHVRLLGKKKSRHPHELRRAFQHLSPPPRPHLLRVVLLVHHRHHAWGAFLPFFVSGCITLFVRGDIHLWIDRFLWYLPHWHLRIRSRYVLPGPPALPPSFLPSFLLLLLLILGVVVAG